MNNRSAIELLTIFPNSFSLLKSARYTKKKCLLNLIEILQIGLYRRTFFLLFFSCACSITRLCNFHCIPLFLMVLSLGTTSVKLEGKIISMSKLIDQTIKNELIISVIKKISLRRYVNQYDTIFGYRWMFPSRRQRADDQFPEQEHLQIHQPLCCQSPMHRMTILLHRYSIVGTLPPCLINEAIKMLITS